MHGTQQDPDLHEWAVNFIFNRDTVSSVGLIRSKSLPGSTNGMGHVCIFRHALALDERRVKFLPEFSNGGIGCGPQPALGRDKLEQVKEVWFAGSHSDM